MRMRPFMFYAFAIATTAYSASSSSSPQHTATRLRVGFLNAPMTVDGPTFASSTLPLAFSWALFHSRRGEFQTSFRIIVAPSPTPSTPNPTPVWDTGLINGNGTGPIPYGSVGPAAVPLEPDTDYEWAVTWMDGTSSSSLPAFSTFSTALFTEEDWKGAVYLSSTNASDGDGGLNAYRATLDLSSLPIGKRLIRARLYITGLGWWRAWINGNAVDDHEIGSQNEAMARILYEVVDVTALLISGTCNTLAVQLGHGWWDRLFFLGFLGPRQFRALVSITTEDGTTTYLATALEGAAASTNSRSSSSSSSLTLPLLFNATKGPITYDDVYGGETYDGTVAGGILGWELCGYSPSNGGWEANELRIQKQSATQGHFTSGSNNSSGREKSDLSTPPVWFPAVVPSSTPAAFNATTSAHHLKVASSYDLRTLIGAITQPLPGVFVYDFGQNTANVVTLTVKNCPPGTVITLQHAEILYPNGSAHNHFNSLAPMIGEYVCGGPGAGGPEVSARAMGSAASMTIMPSFSGLASRLGASPPLGVDGGLGSVEGHRYYFSQMGSRYVQVKGFPGVAGQANVVAHVVHTALADEDAGQFSSSNPLLNKIHHAIRATLLNNYMDVPIDCPQRERHGWVADAFIVFETASYTVDASALYAKWLLQDFPDTQYFNSLTLNASNAIPSFVPFPFNYSHHLNADPAWAASAFLITLQLANLVDGNDAIILPKAYPWLRSYIECLIANASATNGILNYSYWGDWSAASIPGVPIITEDYPQAFFAFSLGAMKEIAERVGPASDAQRYADAYSNATAAYVKAFYDPATGCIGVNCSYSSSIYAISLGIFTPGSIDESKVWAHVAAVINGTNAPYPGRFPGGILTLRLLYPLLDRLGDGWPGVGLDVMFGGPGLDMPSIGYWVGQEGLTTLPEEYNLTSTTPPSFYGAASYDHAMFGGPGYWLSATVAGLKRVGKGWTSLLMAPPSPSSSGIVGSGPQEVTYASTSVDTPIGKSAIAWSMSVNRSGGDIEALWEEEGSEEDSRLSFTCLTPIGWPQDLSLPVFEQVNVRDGSEGVIVGELNRASILQDIQTSCIGRASCSVNIKRVANIDLVYAGIFLTGRGCANASPSYTLSSTVPMGATASVVLWGLTGNEAASGTVLESGTVVWANGTYVPGVVGVVSAQSGPESGSVMVHVGGGAYSFSVIP